MIEKHLSELTDAVLRLTAVMEQARENAPAAEAAKPAPKKKAKAKPAEETPAEPTEDTAADSTATEDDVKAAIVAVTTNVALGRPAAAGVLKAHGAERVSDLTADKFASVISELGKLIEAAA